MDAHEPLLERTYRLLDSRTETLMQISENAGIDDSWLFKFSRRAIPNPGVNLVQKLHDYLSRKVEAA